MCFLKTWNQWIWSKYVERMKEGVCLETETLNFIEKKVYCEQKESKMFESFKKHKTSLWGF